jgi:hypothetical protein
LCFSESIHCHVERHGQQKQTVNKVKDRGRQLASESTQCDNTLENADFDFGLIDKVEKSA